MPSKTQSQGSAKERPGRGASRPGGRPELRFRIRVVKGDAIAIGPGKVDLLVAVDERQSISAAAKALGMSYRRAWLLVDEMNRTLKEPVVATAAGGSHGGGTVLTESGRRLVELYRAVEERAQQACEADIRQLLAMVGPTSKR